MINPLNVASTVPFGNCTTGEIRLTDISDNVEMETRQGQLQICINNAWGSVCNDDYFGPTDARVACNQLDGFSADGAVLVPSNQRTPPFFLEELDCDGEEGEIINCTHYSTIGLASCENGYDVIIQCEGKLWPADNHD